MVAEAPAAEMDEEPEAAKAAPAATPAESTPDAERSDEPQERAAAPPAIPTQDLPRDPARASDVLVHRALPLIRGGQLDRAEATLDRAWELDPKNPQAMAGYARLYLARKDGDRAAKWAKKAVRKRSKRPQYHILYGDALKLQGNDGQARAAWRRALEVDPGNKTARSRLARSRTRTAK